MAEDAPHLFPLSPYKTSAPSQGLAFCAHKNALSVREVEFARGYRLSSTGITPISFTVPRVKSTYFQAGSIFRRKIGRKKRLDQKTDEK